MQFRIFYAKTKYLGHNSFTTHLSPNVSLLQQVKYTQTHNTDSTHMYKVQKWNNYRVTKNYSARQMGHC